MKIFLFQASLVSIMLLVFVLKGNPSFASDPEDIYIWKFKCGPLRSKPVILGKTAFFGTLDGVFYAVNIKTGKERWHFAADSTNSFPAIKDNIVIFESRNKLYALNASSGKFLWGFANNEDSRISIGFTDYHHSSPVISGNMVVYCDQLGFVNGVDIKTGKLISQYQIDSKQAIRGTPVIKDGVVFAGDWLGNVYAISLKDASLIWKHVLENTREYYGAVVSEMIIKDNALFFGSQHDVFSPLNIKTGEPIWVFRDTSHTYLPSTPVFYGNKMFIGTTIFANSVYCFDYLNGPNVEWKFKAEGIFFTTPVVKDSVLIINSNLNFDQKTSIYYFLNCKNGNQIAKLNFNNMGPSIPLLKDDVLYVGSNEGLYAIDYKKVVK